MSTRLVSRPWFITTAALLGVVLLAAPAGAVSPGLARYASSVAERRTDDPMTEITLTRTRGKFPSSAPGVMNPQSRPYGLSYAEWSVKWWQWAYGLPVAGHPLFDETGADCANGQSGPVWFLGGVFNVSGTVTRDLCTVPSGTALFFPIVNAEWDNFCPPTDPPMSIDDLRATVAWFMDLTTDLVCEVDGHAIPNLETYRFAGDPFAVNMPSGNIWEFFGCPTPAGTYEPLVPDGYFVMLAPLPPGKHTIHFRGTIGDPVNFTPEATYNLTVVPAEQAGMADQSSVTSPAPGQAAPAAKRRSWGQVKSIYR